MGEGPCLDSFGDRRPYLVDGLSVDGDRWPVFAGEAAALGVAAVFAFPVAAVSSTLGVLELYRRTPGPLSPIQQQSAAMCAHAAAVSMHHTIDTHTFGPHRGARDAADEQSGFDAIAEGKFSRTEVHMASRMVAVQLGVSVDVALDRVRPRCDGRFMR